MQVYSRAEIYFLLYVIIVTATVIVTFGTLKRGRIAQV